jgi:hypothetical protein
MNSVGDSRSLSELAGSAVADAVMESGHRPHRAWAEYSPVGGSLSYRQLREALSGTRQLSANEHKRFAAVFCELVDPVP